MSQAILFPNPLRRDGTSQRQRLAAALDPSSVELDGRQLSDLLLYSRRYARLLTYYGPDDTPAGNWAEFFDHDPSTVVAAVAETDPQDYRDAFDALYEAIEDAPHKGEAIAALVAPTFELAHTFEDWYGGSAEDGSLRRALDRLAASVLREALRAAGSAALRFLELSLPAKALDPDDWSDVWGDLQTIEADGSLFPSGQPDDEDEAKVAAERLSRIFQRLFEAMVFVVDQAPAFLQETLTSYHRHPPHMALLLAFLQLLEHSRSHLNALSAEHLDFYYRTVLGLSPRGAEGDQVHLLFEIAKRFEDHLVEAGTLLKAGKDASGQELLYATERDLVVNRARIEAERGLKTIFVNRATDGTVANVYAAPDADSLDGLGELIEEDDGKWETFGSADMPYAEIGFAVASPMLLLAEGTRTITLLFILDPNTVELTEAERIAAQQALAGAVKVYASGEKEWIEVAVESVGLYAPSTVEIESFTLLEAALTYTLKLEAGADAVVGYDSEVLGGSFETTWPVVRFVLDNEAEPYPYKYLQELDVTGLALSVEVQGMRNLILENDLGVLDPAKPFHPFGPVPKKGSSFLVGSPEVFHKPLNRLDLTIDWADLPEENFADHYGRYTVNDATGNLVGLVSDNEDFTATFSLLKEGAWTDATTQNLFTDETTETGEAAASAAAPPDPAPAAQRSITLTQTLSRRLGEDFDRFDPTLRQGFLRATLNESFLHGLYPKYLAEEAAGTATNMPNQPYTPLMASLTLGYRASMIASDFETEGLFRIGPFGHRRAEAPDATGDPLGKLVPQFEATVRAEDGTTSVELAEGTLLIGLEDFEPPANLSLLFQVAEGSEDPLSAGQEVAWSYLADDRWVDFKTSEVLSDSTNDLLASGIVRLAAPREMTPARTLMPAGLCWIKAAVASGASMAAKLIGVHTQAVAASFQDQGNDPSHLATAMAAGTISKLKSRAAAVKAVDQPYSSFGGRLEEEGEAFYVRASERLRHRGRAVTIFDYERLVLERFPEVYKVRCLNHTRTGDELAPGHVSLVLVPNLRNKNAVDPLKPRLSVAQLETIREYLESVSSDFAAIEVKNPDYEEVRVSFKVRFHPGTDKGFYTSKLDEEIVGFLSPWLEDDAADLTFGGRMHRSSILDFVERRDYVDFVTDFAMDHTTIADVELIDVEQAEASSSSAALVSAKTHVINHGIVSCRDSEE